MTQTTTIDCRGLQCPEPVLRTARAARKLAASGGTVEVLADDDAFPSDVKSWCRSAGATLISLDAYQNEHRATIRIAPKGEATRAPSTTMVGGAAPLPSVPAAQISTLDCRGLQCPEPVLALARFSRGNPGTEVDVIADDPAFSADIEAWCRSAGAVELSRTTEGAVMKVRVRVANRRPSGPPAKLAPAPAPSVTPAPERRASIVPPPAAPSKAASTAQVRFDLRGMSARQAHEEAARALGLGSSLLVEFLLPDAATAQVVLRAAAGAGHEVLVFEVEGARVVAQLRPSELSAANDQAALRVVSDGSDCTLLVLHNDLESLLAAFLIANGAAAAGQRVMMFFTFWGLNVLRGDQPNLAESESSPSFFQRMFKWLMPRGVRQPLGQFNFAGVGPALLGSIMRGQKVTDLPKLIATASELGVRFVACTMSMSVMGISKRDLHPYPTLEYGGVASFVDSSRTSRFSLVF